MGKGVGGWKGTGNYLHPPPYHPHPPPSYIYIYIYPYHNDPLSFSAPPPLPNYSQLLPPTPPHHPIMSIFSEFSFAVSLPTSLPLFHYLSSVLRLLLHRRIVWGDGKSSPFTPVPDCCRPDLLNIRGGSVMGTPCLTTLLPLPSPPSSFTRITASSSRQRTVVMYSLVLTLILLELI